MDIKLLLNPVKIQVLTLDTGLVDVLDDKFKFRDNQLWWKKKSRELIEKKIIDGCKHLFSVKTLRLPIGFIEELKTILREHNYNPVVEDLRKIPEFNVPTDYNILLKDYDWKNDKNLDGPPKFRYYQEECFDEIVKNGKYAGVVYGATAFGKTLVFLALTQMIEGNILIVFHRKGLVYQTYKTAKKMGYDDFGLISGTSIIPEKRVMLINYQSIDKFDGYKKCKAVFVDEMHNAKANTLYNFLKKVPAVIRIGFSGSPYAPFKEKALDNALNKASFGEIIYQKKADELIDEGFLSEVDINFVKIDFPSKKWYLSHIDAISECIVQNEYRNNIIRKIVEKENKITLILISRLEHGDILNSMIEDSVFLQGETDIEKREEVREAFDDGNVKTVLATSIWFEGVDIPNLGCLIIAGSGKSFYQTIQRIGRILRKTKFKDKGIVYDFDDDTNYHLHDWSMKRWVIYRNENYPIKAIKLNEILKENKDNNRA